MFLERFQRQENFSWKRISRVQTFATSNIRCRVEADAAVADAERRQPMLDGMENQSRAVFNATAGTYDRDRMKLIPGHEAFYGAALQLIPRRATHIVELGAGSGLFSAMLRSDVPDAHLTLVDFSENMLALARTRLASKADVEHITFLLADYTAQPLPRDVDAVVSSLSIHHLEDDRKRALLPKVLAALRPGGVFINADHVGGPTPALEAVYQDRWLASVRALGATEQQIADSLFRQQEDRRAPVAAQLEWMREAGFAEVDCWYKHSSFAVMCGSRPG
jgi:tRNA (cmo5U34)-methyltransferase